MKNNKKSFGKRRKPFKGQLNKKKKKSIQETEINKKALFNRYKNVQKVEEELERKRKMEQKFQRQENTYSDSDEEEGAFGQLVSCFGNTVNHAGVESDVESYSSQSENQDGSENRTERVQKPEEMRNTGDEEIDSGSECDIEVTL